MSVYATSHVWGHSRLKGDALFLLIAIADEANDSGECWPGRKHLANKTRLTERSVQSLTRVLLNSGELEIAQEAHGPGNPRILRVVLPPREHASPRGPGRPPKPKADKVSAAGEDSSPIGFAQREKVGARQREKNGRVKGEGSSTKGRSPAIRYPELNAGKTRSPVNPHSGSAAALENSESHSDNGQGQELLDTLTEQYLTRRMRLVAENLDDPAVMSCISQARKLFKQSGLEWHDFDNRTRDAWHRTLVRREDLNQPPLGTPMAYFFQVLSTLCKQRREQLVAEV